MGTIERKMGMRGSHTCELIFDNCEVPVENVIGGEAGVGQGFKTAMKILDKGRLTMGASALGTAQKLLDLSVDYARQRVQFGKPIAEFQAIQFMLAEMATNIYAARQMLYHAARLRDRQGFFRDQGSLHGQAVLHGNGRTLRGHGRTDPRRHGVHEGLSGGTHLPGRSFDPHLRGNQRNPETGHRPEPAQGVRNMKVGQVFIMGGGLMGSGIGQVCAQAGMKVSLCDISGEALEKARKNISWSVGKFIEKERWPATWTPSCPGSSSPGT